MSKRNLIVPALAGLFPFLVAVGCGGPEDSAANEQTEAAEQGRKPAPESPAELVAQIVRLNEEIRDAAASDSLEDAHGALHKIGTAIVNLRAGIESASMEPDTQSTALAATDRLMELFGEVDATLHGKEGKLYTEVKDEITEQLDVLQDTGIVGEN